MKQALEHENLRKEQAASLLYDVTHHNSIYHSLDRKSMKLHRFVTGQSLRSVELLVIILHLCFTLFEYPRATPYENTTCKVMLLIELLFVLFYFTLLTIRFSIDTRRELPFRLSFAKVLPSSACLICSHASLQDQQAPLAGCHFYRVHRHVC